MSKLQKNAPKTISQKALVRIFKDIKLIETHDVRFCFLVGAGASKSSEIPTGWDLSKGWYNDLKDDLDPQLIKKWEDEVGTTLSLDNVGHFYPFLYEKRYEAAPQIGYEAFKKLMDNKEPSIGYVILSQILAYEGHNFVITTNFDYLIEDAIRMHTPTKPFTAGHETLAEFISSQTERPTIIKVHRDLFLNPFNDNDSIRTLKEEWKNALTPILKNFNLLVIGYGGNDGSLMDYLSEIDTVGRKPIYWCKRKDDILNNKVSNLLTTKDFIVEVDGFDELMYSLYGALEFDIFNKLDDLDNHPLVQSAKKRIQALEEKLKKLITPSNGEQQPIPEDVKNIFEGASKYLLDAYLEKDKNKKTLIYEEGLRQYPEDAPLIVAYASFLGENEEYDKANEYYFKATQINPENSIAFNNWGNNLGGLAKTKTGKEAEELFQRAFLKYERATQINPEYSIAFNNWGADLGGLAKTKTGKEAEELFQRSFLKYERATQINPEYSNAFNNWGNDLGGLAKTKTGKEAEELFQRAFQKYERATQINPENSNAFNNWGNDLGGLAKTKTGKEAEELFQLAFQKYERATQISPENSNAFNNWGADLGGLAKTKTGKEAEELFQRAFQKYERATQINPENSNAFNNWGNDLGGLAKTKTGKEAEELFQLAFQKYERATQINPENSIAFNNWGADLGGLAKTKTGKEAEELFQLAFQKYERATQINPENSNAFNNWGADLGELAKTKTGKEAEELFQRAFQKYERATQINPEYSTAFNNWGADLGGLAKTKTGKEAEELFQRAFLKYERAIQINPEYSNAFNNWESDLEELTKTIQEIDELYEQTLMKYKMLRK